MLSDFMVHPSLATRDAAKAKAWYAEKLGFEPVLEVPGLLVYRTGEKRFTVYETPNAGTAKNTVAGWSVDDLAVELPRLRERGVVFPDLDLGAEGRTTDGVIEETFDFGVETMAWFQDGDGNWIVVGSGADLPGVQPGSNGFGLILAASDLERARRWYSERLGLEPFKVFDDTQEMAYASGRTRFSIYVTDSAGTAKNTVGIWRVDDLRAEVVALRARGVRFEEYDFGDVKTVDGILTDADSGTLNAWFTDSEGNILGLVEDHGPAIP